MRRDSLVTRLMALLFVLALSVSRSPAAAAATLPTRVGQITEYRLPTGYVGPDAITTGPDGNLWFTNVVRGGVAAIARITPTGQITEYPIRSCTGNATGIVVGPDGNLWAMGCFPLVLVRLNPKTGQMSTFTFHFSNYAGESLTVGPDGNLWLLEAPANNTIDRFSLSDHSLTAFAIPTPNAQAYGISSGADGNVWFTEFFANKIGRLNPKTGQVTEFPLDTTGGPEIITPGPKGDTHLWFVETQGFIGQVDPLTAQITQFPTSYGYAGPGISAGPDGHLWFTEAYLIGSVTPSAHFLYRNFSLPNHKNDANAITSGPDGNMWFTEDYGDKIGKITTR